MWKFLGQGLDLYHSSDPSHSIDNAGSLTESPGNSWSIFLISINKQSMLRVIMWKVQEGINEEEEKSPDDAIIQQ